VSGMSVIMFFGFVGYRWGSGDDWAGGGSSRGSAACDRRNRERFRGSGWPLHNCSRC